ncbi:MAG: dienelactone hydrolase family protein [Fimbriimonadaceae bacterium]
MGEMIEFGANGGTAVGYLAMPELPGPGVIVLQEWWGLVGHIKSVADRFAAEGFVAFAPDLYDGESATEPDDAASLFMALNIDHTAKQLAGAVKMMQELPAVEGKVGVVGFCMGGQLSMYAAATNPEIAACVNFYGVHPNVHPPFEKLQAPMLGLFAEHDDYASPAVVQTLDEKLTQLGKTHNFVTYPGAHHAFFNDERSSVYNADAAEDAWKRTLAFFRANLS